MKDTTAVAQSLERGRAGSKYLFLLLSQLGLFILIALVGDGAIQRVVIGLAELAVIAGTIRVMDSRRRMGIAVGAVGVLALLAGVTDRVWNVPGAGAVWSILVVVFLSGAIVLILRDVLRRHDVTADTIRGAICIYLLMGLAFSFLYAFAESVAPGSIFVSTAGPSDVITRESFVYFSFVTLTTLGFGDLVPITRLARSLTWFEAAIGQLFLAVMVARLVGLYIVNHTSRAKA